MQRRCSRMLVKYGLTTAVGGKTPAADLYYAAVAKLIETGEVAEWVRRRDLRKGYCGKDAGAEPFRDPYWQLKLKCNCLWVPDNAADAATTRTRPTDPHSGLRLENQLEVLRRTSALGLIRRASSASASTRAPRQAAGCEALSWPPRRGSFAASEATSVPAKGKAIVNKSTSG